jgi:hypothetical protein
MRIARFCQDKGVIYFSREPCQEPFVFDSLSHRSWPAQEIKAGVAERKIRAKPNDDSLILSRVLTVSESVRWKRGNPDAIGTEEFRLMRTRDRLEAHPTSWYFSRYLTGESSVA